MLDIRVLREQMAMLRDALSRRGALTTLTPELERDRRTLIQAVEEKKAARNASSQEVAQRKKKGENADDLIAKGRELGAEIAKGEADLSAAEEELKGIVMGLPNITLPEVPAGGEDNNTIVKEWGKPRKDAGLKPHWELADKLRMLDVERGA